MSNRYGLPTSQYDDALKAFRDAVSAVGTQKAAADACGCTQGNISQLLKSRSLPSGPQARKLAEVSGIPEWRLRPDIFKPETTSHVLPSAEVVEGGAPVVPGDRRAISQCVKS